MCHISLLTVHYRPTALITPRVSDFHQIRSIRRSVARLVCFHYSCLVTSYAFTPPPLEFGRRDEHVIQNLCQSAVREHLAKYVKYKASLFYFYFIFPRTRLLKWPMDGFRRTMVQSTRCDARKSLLGSTRWPTTFWGSKFPKTVKNGLLYSRSSRYERLQDEWRHRRLTYTIYSILEINPVLYFPMIEHNAAKVSADALYSVRNSDFMAWSANRLQAE